VASLVELSHHLDDSFGGEGMFGKIMPRACGLILLAFVNLASKLFCRSLATQSKLKTGVVPSTGQCLKERNNSGQFLRKFLEMIK